MKTRSFTQLALLSLPLLGFLGAIGRAEAIRIGAPRHEMKIEGYDPRDLVRGNYLLYKFVSTSGSGQTADPVTGAIADTWDHLACVAPGPGREKQVLLFPPQGPKPTACLAEIPRDFIESEHRFYVQQDKAMDFERFVREGRASVILVMPSGSRPAAEQLLIDGKPAKDARPDD